MSDLRLNNSIFLMYIATEEFKRRYNITLAQLLEIDLKYRIFNYISDCPDIFDNMTKSEMVDELDEYIAANQ